MLKRLVTIRRGLAAIVVVAACGRTPPTSSPTPAAGTAAAPSRQTTAITDGESLIRAMHERYAGKWYHTMTFVQTTTITRTSQTPTVQTWYEAASLPGMLRIDV